MSFLTTGINLDQLADAGSIPNGYLLAFNGTTKRFEPIAPPSGGEGGSSISNSAGSASIDAAGNLVVTGDLALNGRVKQISGLPTGPDRNGVGATRVAGSIVWNGVNIGGPAPFIGQRASTLPGPSGGLLLYVPQPGTVDSDSWVDTDFNIFNRTVGSATAGLLRVHAAWMTGVDSIIIERDILTGWDITKLHNFEAFDLGCLVNDASLHGPTPYSIWVWITDDGTAVITDPANPPEVIIFPHVVQH